MSNQPLRVDESQNARNHLSPGGGKNPAVKQVTSLTAQGIIDVIQTKQGSAVNDARFDSENRRNEMIIATEKRNSFFVGNIGAIEDVLNNTLALSHNRDIREVLQQDTQVKDIAEQIAQHLSNHSVRATNIVRKENGIKVIMDPTQPGSQNYTLFLSFQNDHLVIEGRHGSLHDSDGYYHQAHWHRQERFFDIRFQNREKDGENSLTFIPTALPEVFHNDSAVQSAIENTEGLYRNNQSHTVSNITRKNGAIFVDITWRPHGSKKTTETSQWKITRNQRGEVTIERPRGKGDPIEIHWLDLPHEEHRNIRGSDRDAYILPAYLKNADNARKIFEDILRTNYADQNWNIKNIYYNQKIDNNEVIFEMDGFDNEFLNRKWVMGRNWIEEITLENPLPRGYKGSTGFPVILPKEA